MLQLWRIDDGRMTPTAVVDPLDLVSGDSSRLALLVPVERQRPAIAALVVPGTAHGAVAQNGVPLPAGLHLLAHADRLDFGGRTCWVAAAAELRSEAYAPEDHGEDIYCFILKARLQAGEEIVVCPGHPGAEECGIICKREAWEMARQASPEFRCPQCGFDPAAGPWEPAVRKRGSLARLLALAEQHKG